MLKMIEPVAVAITADVASIASLIVTGLVALQVHTLKKTLLARTRIPEAILDLEKAANLLRESLKEWPDQGSECDEVIQRLDSILVNIVPKVSGAEKRKVSETRSLIKKRTSIRSKLYPPHADERKNEMWDIHNALAGTIEALQQLNKDNTKRVV